MMNTKNILIALICATTLIACGSDENENFDVEKNPMEALIKMGENMQKQAEKIEEKQKNRENASAMHYEELMKYLPESIEGYEKNEPKGESVEMGEMSFSSAEVRFKNQQDEIKITLLDYNAALSMYSMATAMWSTGFKIDNSKEKSQSVKLTDEITGWETILKKSKDASLILGINDRFLLTIEAENQENTDLLKEIAKQMDLSKLSSL